MTMKALAVHGVSEGQQALYDSAMEVPIDTVADMFAMSRAQLAQTVGLSPEVLQKARLRSARKTQARLREMLEIVTRVSDWAGGRMQAMAWYKAQPIPAFGDRTAESMVKTGHAAAVRDYLDHMALGGYA